jgi:hypothetical protein
MSSRREPTFEFVAGVKPSATMLAQIHLLVEECVKHCVDESLEKTLKKILDDRLEKIVRKCLEEREKGAESEVIELKKIPKKKAIILVKSYIDKHQGCRTSDIIYDLALDPTLVMDVLQVLKNMKKVKGVTL